MQFFEDEEDKKLYHGVKKKKKSGQRLLTVMRTSGKSHKGNIELKKMFYILIRFYCIYLNSLNFTFNMCAFQCIAILTKIKDLRTYLTLFRKILEKKIANLIFI